MKHKYSKVALRVRCKSQKQGCGV